MKVFIFFSKIDFIQFFLHKLLYHLFLVQNLYQEQEYYFFLVLACEELLPKFAPKIIQFLPTPLPKLNSPCLSNPIPYPLYLCLSISVFLVKLTAPTNNFLVLDNCCCCNSYLSHKQCIC